MKGNENQNKAIIQWACDYLSSHGYTLKSNLPEEVQNTPWSSVVRFTTSNGYIYLKRTPKLIALEADIIQILHDQFKFSVPEIIAKNTELNCFLMKDEGRALRGLLKNKFDVDLFSKAIDQFTLMQVEVSDHVKVLLDIGVPDWRLNKLPDLFKQLLAEKNILMADGLSEIEIAELERLLPRIADLCEKLSRYAIKETLVQPDFHDNNTLINETSQKMTVIDLGEIVISHPFFSLINCLHQAKKHYELIEGDAAYQQLLDACSKNYLAFESKNNLLDAFAIARVLLFVYGALANYRLMLACGIEKLMAFQHGRLSGQLKELVIALDLG